MRNHSERHGGGKVTKVRAQKRSDIDLLCLSARRWEAVPAPIQLQLIRCSGERRVFFFEEPTYESSRESSREPSREAISDEPFGKDGCLLLKPQCDGQMVIAVPQLPIGLSPEEIVAAQQRMIDRLILGYKMTSYLLCYYTPSALPFTRHLNPRGVIYESMQDMSMLPTVRAPSRTHNSDEAQSLAACR